MKRVERNVGTADLVGDALAVLGESGWAQARGKLNRREARSSAERTAGS